MHKHTFTHTHTFTTYVIYTLFMRMYTVKQLSAFFMYIQCGLNACIFRSRGRHLQDSLLCLEYTLN